MAKRQRLHAAAESARSRGDPGPRRRRPAPLMVPRTTAAPRWRRCKRCCGEGAVALEALDRSGLGGRGLGRRLAGGAQVRHRGQARAELDDAEAHDAVGDAQVAVQRGRDVGAALELEQVVLGVVLVADLERGAPDTPVVLADDGRRGARQDALGFGEHLGALLLLGGGVEQQHEVVRGVLCRHDERAPRAANDYSGIGSAKDARGASLQAGGPPGGMNADLLHRIRWANVARAAAVLLALALVVGWPRLRGQAEPLPPAGAQAPALVEQVGTTEVPAARPVSSAARAASAPARARRRRPRPARRAHPPPRPPPPGADPPPPPTP